ncbi:MAG: glycoside hydrolase family 2 [Clostridiales bacterium]|jgi:beta-galactosidase/beta-glucuronidase|nr:glycoside hydrolase family 2 [Clostridiales bacterium]
MQLLFHNTSPQPDWERKTWASLDGEWGFCFDDADEGIRLGYPDTGHKLGGHITVPYAYQCAKSRVGDTAIHPVVWYKRSFKAEKWMREGRTFICFGAVDYACDIWINGIHIGGHKGGYIGFKFEITSFVKDGDTEVTLRVVDMPDPAQSRGKQYWKETPSRCWYVASTGIWQTVWLESVSGIAMEYAHFTPDIDNASVGIELLLEEFAHGLALEMEISYQGRVVLSQKTTLSEQLSTLSVALPDADYIDEIHYWSPENPNLYDVALTLTKDGVQQDAVNTYFGMRKIAVEDGKLTLNNRPLYLKMILDQGYWKDGDLTPPTPESFYDDINAVKRMGFNGIRKHQKIEDRRFYYWADKLGVLVWGELPSAYRYGLPEIENLTSGMLSFVRRDYNHPSIIAWVPLNESWGVRKMRDSKRQQNFGKALYALLKSVDPTRLVSTNDGWENVQTDIISIHDYSSDLRGSGLDFLNIADYKNHYPMGRRLFSSGTNPQDIPDAALMVTEYGGAALCKDTGNGAWGYAEGAADASELAKTYEKQTKAIMKAAHIQGFCYTQLTDVHQEVNGLLDSGHNFKVDPGEIARINGRR